ncbi:MAG TPA: ABC transporter substrate-binding protein [Chloroflexota bacterium]|nr:ABC transporter substrate-binding protein [Chloroflexota bacterium]
MRGFGLLRALGIGLAAAVMAACQAPAARAPSPAPAAPGGAPAAAAPTVASATAGGAATAAPSDGAPAAYRPGPPLSPRVKVVLADIKSTADGGFYLALDKGYFAEEGLDVEMTPFDTSALQVSALGTNQLDVGVGSLNAGLLNAVGRGVKLKIVADRATLINGALSFMVRKELIDSGQIQGWQDFKGRPVANNGTGTAAQLALIRGLASAGLTLNDVDQKIVGFADMVPALNSGALDMGVMIEPLISAAIERGIAVRWQRAIDAFPNLEIAQVYYSEGFAQNTEAANRFMIAYLRGVREYNDGMFKMRPNRPEVIQSLINHTSIKDPALYDKMEMSWVNPNGHLQVENLKEQQREFAALGLLEGPPVDLDRIVDTSYVENALRVLGVYQE